MNSRTDWFQNAAYGMFVHWGLYSLLGRGEWALNRERIPLDEYVKLADDFQAENFRPREWAALARDAGMKYVVLTTKHHEGFCLWNSKVCAFNSVNSAAKRDLLAEYVEAIRDAGLQVGLYYSLGDWFNEDWTRGWSGDGEENHAARERFMDYTHALVEELLTGYGRIDILWYDLPQNYSAAQWRSVDLNHHARVLQPEILINNRALTSEDFGTPEQHVTALDEGRLWEACLTLNGNWGFVAGDPDWKSPREIALNLANAASGGGNLLLNVGPDGSGKIPQESEAILRRVGRWLDVHGESIYGAQRHNLSFNLWGPVTVRRLNDDNYALYLHLKNYFGETLTIGGLTNQVRRASVLSSGAELRVERRDAQTILHGLPASPPDEILPVVKLEIEGAPDHDLSRVIGGADVFPKLP